jgi:hypothetical protein
MRENLAKFLTGGNRESGDVKKNSPLPPFSSVKRCAAVFHFPARISAA